MNVSRMCLTICLILILAVTFLNACGKLVGDSKPNESDALQVVKEYCAKLSSPPNDDIQVISVKKKDGRLSEDKSNYLIVVDVNLICRGKAAWTRICQNKGKNTWPISFTKMESGWKGEWDTYANKW